MQEVKTVNEDVLVQSLQSARLPFKSTEWVPPSPQPQRECCSSPLWVQRGTHSLCGGGGGGGVVDPHHVDADPDSDPDSAYHPGFGCGFRL
jgi:hypothetical protein